MWVGSITVRAGDYRVGIRSDDASTLARLEDRYALDLVDDDRDDADLGLAVGEVQMPGGGRMLPTLFHGRKPVLRSRRVERLLDVTDQFLGGIQTTVSESPEHIGLRGFGGFARRDRVVLVPERCLGSSTIVERLAASEGATVIEAHGLTIRRHDGALVVPAGPAAAREAGLDSLSTPPGALTIGAMTWPSAYVDQDERPALVLTRLLTLVDPLPRSGRREWLEVLAEITRRSHVRSGVDDRLKGGLADVFAGIG